MPETKKKILIVEDNASIMEAVVLALKEEGFKIDLANDGNEGVNKIKENHYDLVILDLVMPGSTGFEVMHELEMLGLHPPIIIYSNMPEEDTQAEALKLGAKDFLSKTTISLEELVKKVKKHIEGNQNKIV